MELDGFLIALKSLIEISSLCSRNEFNNINFSVEKCRSKCTSRNVVNL